MEVELSAVRLVASRRRRGSKKGEKGKKIKVANQFTVAGHVLVPLPALLSPPSLSLCLSSTSFYLYTSLFCLSASLPICPPLSVYDAAPTAEAAAWRP